MADSSRPGPLDSRLNALKAAYRQRLVSDLAQIEQLLQTFSQSPEDPDHAALLHQALHKLAGSAGTFGFEQLGQQARLFEQQLASQLQQLSTDPSWLLPINMAQLHQALSADEHRNSSSGLETASTAACDSLPLIGLLERDPMLAEYISQQLRSFGFCVRHVQDAQALALLRQLRPPDLLIVDHRAGPSTILDTDPVPFWQQTLSEFSCPFLFVGAEESYTARLQAIRCGGSGYFVKPLDVPKLAAQVAALLRTKERIPERVLLVESDPQTAHTCLEILQAAGLEVHWLEQPEQLIHVACEFDPELVLMAMNLPRVSGVELVAMLTQFERWAQLPVVYLSLSANSDQRLDALIRGGDACLVMPVEPSRLVGLCRSRVQRLRELKQAIARDGLTGLLKHASIKEALADEAAVAARQQRNFSVVMLDIDHFKAVNDTHGHAIGDLVIAAVGTLLRQHFRSTDKLGRYGGEEFVLVLPSCSAASALALVDSLRQAFAAIQFMGGGQHFSCTLSAGVADQTSFAADGAESLLDRADQALYEAKQSGRNRVCLAEPSQHHFGLSAEGDEP